MSDFHKEAEHTGFALLFDSYKIEEKYKSRCDIPYFVIKDKEEKRVHAMLDSAMDLGNSFAHNQASAIACVAIAHSEEEYLLMQAGLLSVKPQGLSVCLACLTKAIETCKEQLEVLNDIQEMTKTYASKL